MTLSKRQDAVLQYLSANRKRVLVEALLKATGIRYATFLCILLMLQACQPGTDTATHSAGTSTEGVPTIQLMAPRILLDTRAVDTASLGVEVEVSYIVSGTNYQESGLAARSGSVWELDIAVPRNTPFEIRMTWFENGETRLDLARITRSSDGFSDSGRLSFSQDFSSADSFSDSPGADDYDGFNDDEDSLTNLEELINGTDPLDSSDPSPGGPLVEDPPSLDLQTTTLPLVTAAGTEVSGFLTVANAGGQSLDYSIESDSDWLTVSPAGGQIARGTSENLQVNASCGSMEESRSGTLTFTTNGGNATVSVELTCQPLPPGPPALNITTTQLPLTASAENTASDVLTLENTGGQSLEYSIESDSDWLSVSPAGGQIAGAASQDVEVSGNCGSTSETRSGTLAVTTNGGNGTVAVQLTCSVGPVIEFPPSLSVNLSASINETASDTITLGNSGDAELSYSLSSDAAWLAVSPQQGAIAAGETVEIGVSGACGADATELSDTISLVSNGGNAEFTINLSCTGGPVLSDVSPASIQLAAEVSQTTQSSLSFTNTGTDTLNYTLQTGENWLCLDENNESPCSTGATTLSGQLSPGASTVINVFGTCSAAAETLSGFVNLTSNADNAEIPVTLICQQPSNPIVNGYEFINVENGAVDTIGDFEDSVVVSVVQTVPVADSPSPSSIDTPITLFFDDKLLFESLFNNFLVLQNDEKINGTVTITESSNGFALITFVPSNPYDSGVTVTLSLAGGEDGVLDDGGNELLGNTGDDFVLSITTIDENSQGFDNNLGFENVDSDGIVFSGDGAVQFQPNGCLSATEGNNFAAISTGFMLVSSGSAIGETSSTLQIGPINIDGETSSLLFDFNFVSAEFREYIGSEFDDSATLSVTGPEGTSSEVLTTVNIAGAGEGQDINQCVEGVGGLPFGEDGFIGQTGWITKTLTGIEDLGSPIIITFTITDVGDESFDSILAIDNIRF